MAALFSCGRDDVAQHAAQLVEENKELRRQLRGLEEVAAEVEAQRLLSSGLVQPDGTRIVAHVFDGGEAESGKRDAELVKHNAEFVKRDAEFMKRDAESLKKLAHALMAQPRTIALLGSKDNDTARLVFARSADAPGDMNVLMREACALVDGRGGGKPEIAQGGGKNVERLQEAIDRVVSMLAAALGSVAR